MQKVSSTAETTSSQAAQSDTLGPKSLALKQSTSQSSLGQSAAMRRDLMKSPDTHFSVQSSQGGAGASGVFGASRGSAGNIRIPFGSTTTS